MSSPREKKVSRSLTRYLSWLAGLLLGDSIVIRLLSPQWDLTDDDAWGQDGGRAVACSLYEESWLKRGCTTVPRLRRRRIAVRPKRGRCDSHGWLSPKFKTRCPLLIDSVASPSSSSRTPAKPSTTPTSLLVIGQTASPAAWSCSPAH